jgi:hypothetical protein
MGLNPHDDWHETRLFREPAFTEPTASPVEAREERIETESLIDGIEPLYFPDVVDPSPFRSAVQKPTGEV